MNQRIADFLCLSEKSLKAIYPEYSEKEIIWHKANELIQTKERMRFVQEVTQVLVNKQTPSLELLGAAYEQSIRLEGIVRLIEIDIFAF